MLGFFSSSAINVLADGFAAFLYNGGRMRLIINDMLSDEDKSAILNGTQSADLPFFDLNDLEAMKATLSKRDEHFFECLAWLIRNERIEIRVVRPAKGCGIAHAKCGTFSDGLSKVSFEGSVNFSYTALVQNMESMTVACDWNGNTDMARVLDTQASFDKTFNGEDADTVFVELEDIGKRLADTFEQKDLKHLLDDELELLNQKDEVDLPLTVAAALSKSKKRVSKAIERMKIRQAEEAARPHFPYLSGPRDYQVEAFNRWKDNKQKGLFAMATGTGKTLTSLNCLLQIYNKLEYYKAIILVPTLTLVEQWADECMKFNFTNIIRVCSKNKTWKTDVDTIKYKEEFNPTQEEPSYIIIATYASFAREAVFYDLTHLGGKTHRQLLLIADEAHNMGSRRILDKLDGVPYLRRIGLSATPERQFDDRGNRELMKFFGCENGEYTYVFDMQEAIEKGFLCRYYYYPHLVRLTDDEMAEYLKISSQLAKFYNNDSNSFVDDDDILMRLLLKRKRIIHKAKNKEPIFKHIVEERFKQQGNLKYTLVYVPEGVKPDDETADCFDTKESVEIDAEQENLIDIYTGIVQDVSPTMTVRKFTSGVKERNQILSEFASGSLQVLTSMKCLDEGVDVPRSELAIFCASTGNPRQFIQRRGRILRNHPDKRFAVIHDLVVAPEINDMSDSYNMERNLLCNELKRVRDFAGLSENADYAYEELEDVLSYYNLSLF
jgi:superfamily II DNA or RNA helicase